MTPRLLKTHSLVVTRKSPTGEYNDDGDWVDGTTLDPFTVKGSLQPFRQGKSKVELPDGVRQQDVRLFYTKAILTTSDEILNQEADTTLIDGIPYECWYVEPWVGNSLMTDHHKVFWVREDRL